MVNHRHEWLCIYKKALLIEDNAGWHRNQKVKTPEGVSREYLPAYSSELQPAERLWFLVDEPLVNQYFNTIDEVEEILLNHCRILSDMKAEMKRI